MCSLIQDGTVGTGYESPLAVDADDSKSTQERWDCSLRQVGLVNGATGEVRSLDCKRWACVEHGPKLAWRWRQRVSMVPWTLMLTLTLVPETQAGARAAWSKMTRFLKAHGMRTYLRVMELGPKGGMRHWHVLIDAPWIEQRELSEVALGAGLGSIVWVSRVKDREGATYYLLGYVFKSLGVTNGRQDGWRKLTVSRNIPSWPKVLRARHDVSSDRDSSRWDVAVGTYRHMPDALTYESWLARREEVFDGRGTDLGEAPGTGADEPQVVRVRGSGTDGEGFDAEGPGGPGAVQGERAGTDQ